jgi:hypothetical protein
MATAAVGGPASLKKSQSDTESPTADMLPSASAPSLDKYRRSISEASMGIMQKWTELSKTKPQSELTMGSQASCMCSYGNLVFCIDQASQLNIYEKSFKVELKLKHTTKLSVPGNVRSMAVNEQHLAICYAGLKKEQLKGAFKNLSSSGVLLYKRDDHVVCSVHERHIETGGSGQFKSPTSLAMTDKYLYVCDRELKTLFQFDVKTSGVVNSVTLAHSDPNSMSLNASNLIVSDALNSNVYLYDTQNLTLLNSVCVKNIDKTQGAMDVYINEEDMIFLRVSESQLAMIDINFELRAYFTEIQTKINSLVYLKDQQAHMLVVGGVTGKQFKLYGYAISLS